MNNKIFTSDKPLEEAIEEYFNKQRTGKIYQTRFYKFSVNQSSEGIKLLDNKNLVCVPSTDTQENKDDYQNISLFKWYNVNYVRDDDGSPRPIAIEGDDNYKTTGNVDVGVMQMSFYYLVEEKGDYQYWSISDTPHEGFKPWSECIKSDGTVLPWTIGSKYFCGYVNDLPRSQPNLIPCSNDISYNSLINMFKEKGTGYHGAGIERAFFFTLMCAIKYATKNSQSVMMGCCDYDTQVDIIRCEGNKVFIPNKFKEDFPVGNRVAIGSGDDRDFSAKDIKQSATILSKEVTDSYVVLNLDVDVSGISSAIISTMPLKSGDTDTVIGNHDGSRNSNTDGRHTLRIQGREYCPGLYQVISNVIWRCNSDATHSVFYVPRGVKYSKDLRVISSEYIEVGKAQWGIPENLYVFGYGNINEISVDMNSGCWIPVRNGNRCEWSDYCHVGITPGTDYEWAVGGCLTDGNSSGSCCLCAEFGAAQTSWYFGCAD